MSYCSKCGQEYEESVLECVDCGVSLGSPQENVVEEDGSGKSAVVFRASDEKVLDLMGRAVAVHHIPVQMMTEIPELELKGHLLLVPGEMGDKVQQILDEGVPMLISEGEGKDRVYRMYKPGEEEEIRAPELLTESLESLVERGDEVLDELIEIVARGDKASRHRAAYILASLGEKGLIALVKLLKVAIEKEQESLILSILRVIREEFEGGSQWQEFVDGLHGSETAKILALQVICAFQNIEAFSCVLPLLDDPSPAVRDEADNVLCTLSDEDLGFDTHADESERAAVAEKWREWWTEEEARRNG